MNDVDKNQCSVLGRAAKNGLRWNEIGMDFSDVQLHEKEVQQVIDVYITGAKQVYSDYFLRRHRTRDFSVLQHANADITKRFVEDGFIQIDDWGIDMDKLQAEAETAWVGNAQQTHGIELKSLEPLFTNMAVLEMISFYLGREAKLRGYKLFRLSRTTTVANYISGMWHHDNCGTRLKLFIYFQDVGDAESGGAPTEVAPGSQTIAYYNYKIPGTNRFDNSFVRSRFAQPQAMKGKRGGGFIFDTNSVHRGNIETKRQEDRDVVILDFTAAGAGFGCREGGFAAELSIPYPGKSS